MSEKETETLTEADVGELAAPRPELTPEQLAAKALRAKTEQLQELVAMALSQPVTLRFEAHLDTLDIIDDGGPQVQIVLKVGDPTSKGVFTDPEMADLLLKHELRISPEAVEGKRPEQVITLVRQLILEAASTGLMSVAIDGAKAAPPAD